MKQFLKHLFLFVVVLAIVVSGLNMSSKPTQQKMPQVPPPPKIEVVPTPKMPTISVVTPSYLTYPQIASQLDQWNKEAPDLTERGSYGRTSRGQTMQYLRVTNTLDKSPKKVVMITGCIHGNEPLSTGTVMSWVGNTLSQYGKDKEVTDLVNSRDIYFVPVVSPDSYPNSRFVDGVDPNRNFPHPQNPKLVSVPPIKSIQDFFLKIKPNAVISTHTWGRALLVPYGDSMVDCPDFASYKDVVGRMCQLSNYKFMRMCDMYGPRGLNIAPPQGQLWGSPIYGSECDWYYRNGAFAIVAEVGMHQRIPTLQDIQTESTMTHKAMLLFVKEAPNVKLK